MNKTDSCDRQSLPPLRSPPTNPSVNTNWSRTQLPASWPQPPPLTTSHSSSNSFTGVPRKHHITFKILLRTFKMIHNLPLFTNCDWWRRAVCAAVEPVLPSTSWFQSRLKLFNCFAVAYSQKQTQIMRCFYFETSFLSPCWSLSAYQLMVTRLLLRFLSLFPAVCVSVCKHCWLQWPAPLAPLGASSNFACQMCVSVLLLLHWCLMTGRASVLIALAVFFPFSWRFRTCHAFRKYLAVANFLMAFSRLPFSCRIPGFCSLPQ